MTGEITYATLCHNNEYYCNENHECVNPCDETEYTECQTCTPVNGAAQINNKSNTTTCGNGSNYICQNGECTNPCTEESTTCITYTAENGECISTLHANTPCGTESEHKACGTTGACDTCAEGYEMLNHACVTVCPEGYERDESGECVPQFYCDNGTIEEQDGVEVCCRGYRDDAEDWVGFEEIACCPRGTSVNGSGECVACGEGYHYNMTRAAFHHLSGTQACGNRCVTNEDCPSDQFCFMDAFATASDTSVDPIIGTCFPLTAMYPNEEEVFVDGVSAGRWVVCENEANWWGARNFCLRYGNVDLPSLEQICGADLEAGANCRTPMALALYNTLGALGTTSKLSASGQAYYVAGGNWGYNVKVKPEMTARARAYIFICGPIQD